MFNDLVSDYNYTFSHWKKKSWMVFLLVLTCGFLTSNWIDSYGLANSPAGRLYCIKGVTSTFALPCRLLIHLLFFALVTMVHLHLITNFESVVESHFQFPQNFRCQHVFAWLTWTFREEGRIKAAITNCCKYLVQTHRKIFLYPCKVSYTEICDTSAKSLEGMSWSCGVYVNGDRSSVISNVHIQ